MSSRTKNHRTVFFGAISITRFCAFLGIFANFRKIANHYFPNFYQNTDLMENQNMAYLIANLMRISKIAMKISINVILTSQWRHQIDIFVIFWSIFTKNHFKILVKPWYDLYIVCKRCFIAFSHYLGQNELIWGVGRLPSCIL